MILYLALSYANGYEMKDKSLNPYYMISVDIPDWSKNWKFLSGAAFTVPISIVGIFMVTFRKVLNPPSFRVLSLTESTGK